MYGAWIGVSGWGATGTAFVLSAAEIAIAALVSGWIVGGRLPPSIAGRLVGTVAFGPVAYLVLLPFNVLGATWEDVQVGRVSSGLEALAAGIGYLLYGALTATYVGLYLIPFGAAWMLTLLLLRRAFDR